MNSYISNNQLLPGAILSDHNPITGQVSNQFMPSDSRELFEINRNKFPEKRLENFDISYNLNSNGYRAPEWNTIDWKNSVVIFGCSIVFGIGLSNENTISYKLEKLLNRPVINLGVPGSGPTYALHNSYLFFKNFGIPNAVISMWSSLDRTHVYQQDKIIHHGPWSESKIKNFYYHWAIDSDINCETHNYFSAIGFKHFWQTKTKYAEATVFENSSQILNCKIIKTVDYGRDLIHPGSKTTDQIAEYLYQIIGP